MIKLDGLGGELVVDSTMRLSQSWHPELILQADNAPSYFNIERDRAVRRGAWIEQARLERLWEAVSRRDAGQLFAHSPTYRFLRLHSVVGYALWQACRFLTHHP